MGLTSKSILAPAETPSSLLGLEDFQADLDKVRVIIWSELMHQVALERMDVTTIYDNRREPKWWKSSPKRPISDKSISENMEPDNSTPVKAKSKKRKLSEPTNDERPLKKRALKQKKKPRGNAWFSHFIAAFSRRKRDDQEQQKEIDTSDRDREVLIDGVC